MGRTSLVVAIATTLTLAGCGQEASTQAPEKPVLDTEEQMQAYAFGAQMGQFVGERLTAQEDLKIVLDRDLIKQGFLDGIAGTASMEQEAIQSSLLTIEAAIRQAQELKQSELSLKSIEEGKAFLAQNATKEGITVTESGLQYEVLEAGDGPKPVAEDTVKVHYKGTLLDGTEFDSSYGRGEPAVFPLNRVIAGWTEGVQLMPVGSKYKFYIPSELAYGTRNTGSIPANSTLTFEVELLSIESQ
jgi:FKBP-type peptidyl-prolyl cis-trans isomerase FkpA